jgi:hypothetical protein
MRKPKNKGGSSLPGRLGTGEWGGQEDFMDEARRMFLREIQVTAPIAIERLQKMVWPEFLAAEAAFTKKRGVRPSSVGFPWPDKLLQAVYDWAKVHHLLQESRVPEWLRHQVRSTFLVWRLYPQRRSIGRFGWAGIYTGYTTCDSIPAEDLTIAISEFTWHPRKDDMSRKDAERFFLERIELELKARMDEIETLVAKRGFIRTPELREDTHVKWAVRFQILGERVTDIAASIGDGDGNERTVNGSPRFSPGLA